MPDYQIEEIEVRRPQNTIITPKQKSGENSEFQTKYDTCSSNDDEEFVTDSFII